MANVFQHIKHVNIIAICTLIFSFYAQAQSNDCDLRFVSASDLYWSASNGAYSPDDATNYLQFQLSVSNVGTRQCDWHITATAGIRGNSNYKRGAYNGNDMIEYDLLSTQSISSSFTIMDYPSITRDEQTLNGTRLQTNSTVEANFFMAVEANQYVPAGIYVDTITLKLYEESPLSNNRVLQDTITVNVAIPVELSITLNIGTPTNGSHYLLDYGTLETGAARSVDMWISSTSYYSLMISSQNRGQLQHLEQANEEIGYTLRYNGSTVNLDRSFPAFLSLLEEPSLWKSFQLNFEIDYVPSDAKSGDYQDVLEISVIDL